MYLPIPQYEGLNLETILGKIKGNQEVLKYLPDPQEIKKCPKQWLINVIYSVIKNPFGKWVKNQIENRNKKV